MATRSTIGYYDKHTGKVTATYCHWDGYYEGVGKTLINNYKTEELAFAVAHIGYISSLEETLPQTKVAAHHQEQCVVYSSVEEYLQEAPNTGAEFAYLWDGLGWFGADLDIDPRFTDMETILENIANV